MTDKIKVSSVINPKVILDVMSLFIVVNLLRSWLQFPSGFNYQGWKQENY